MGVDEVGSVFFENRGLQATVKNRHCTVWHLLSVILKLVVSSQYKCGMVIILVTQLHSSPQNPPDSLNLLGPCRFLIIYFSILQCYPSWKDYPYLSSFWILCCTFLADILTVETFRFAPLKIIDFFSPNPACCLR